MSLTNLNRAEREVVRECLRAAGEGPFFPDWKFQTLFGLERKGLKSILESWPNLDEDDESVVLAINNSLNNLLGYPCNPKEQEWSKFISASKADVQRIFDMWKGRNVQSYFDGSM